MGANQLIALSLKKMENIFASYDLIRLNQILDTLRNYPFYKRSFDLLGFLSNFKEKKLFIHLKSRLEKDSSKPWKICVYPNSKKHKFDGGYEFGYTFNNENEVVDLYNDSYGMKFTPYQKRKS